MTEIVSPADRTPREPTWSAQSRPGPKISHLLAMDIRRQILRGDLVEGQQLPPEAELMSAFDVSRDTLREALRILESQSLVEIRRGRGGGAVVRRPGLASVGGYVALVLQLRRCKLLDLEEARSVIEPPAAELLGKRAGDEVLDHLVALNDDERAAEGDPLAFVAAVARFDQAMTELSGNRSLGVIAGVLRDVYAGQAYVAVRSRRPAQAERYERAVLSGHADFLEAARNHDGNLAKQAWTDYLAGASKLLINRSVSRQRIDVIPLWRAQADLTAGDQPRPIAAAVAAEIRCRIAGGRLLDQDRLPSLADLADEFGISRPTLREALRILEMERLLDLRTGDRGGARVRHPSTQVAAQMAGTIFEARQTTVADFYRALRLVEPVMMELAATRAHEASLRILRTLSSEMAASASDIPRFLQTWTRGRAVAFAATRNPALGVVAEILQWVRLATQPTITAGAAVDLLWVNETHSMVTLFADLVDAFELGDGARARKIWGDFFALNAPYLESSGLGRLLVVELLD